MLRQVFALLALLAVQRITLIRRKGRRGRQETPSILDMSLSDRHDAANIARLIQCQNLCGSFSLRAKKKQLTSSCQRHETLCHTERSLYLAQSRGEN